MYDALQVYAFYPGEKMSQRSKFALLENFSQRKKRKAGGERISCKMKVVEA